MELLLQISFLQRSKANHNKAAAPYIAYPAVTNIISSKIESKSQQKSTGSGHFSSCYKYHFFKDRKQITTVAGNMRYTNTLLQISFLQRSKANHNTTGYVDKEKIAVTNIISSKIESKSQHVN